MSRRPRLFLVALAAASLLAAGCAGFIDKPQRPTLYDMGPLPALTASAQSPVAGNPHIPLVLPDIEAAGALESSALLYRLGYLDDHQLRAYSLSRWSAPPPQLVRQRLRQQLGRERPVLNLDESASLARERPRSIYMLRLELEDFAQVFDAPERSRGVVRLRATLFTNSAAGEQLIGQRSISVEGAAPTPDASGGVRALAQATDAAAADIGTWLRELREAQ
jgi:cholesterol transport system auxiliary component